MKVCIVGVGKIAQDQHAPSILADPTFELIAIAGGRGQRPAEVRYFADHQDLLAAMASQIDAVAICTPPVARYAIARDCLNAGLAVLMEKPPTATLAALDDLVAVARQAGTTLYTGWHSQHAPAVVPAAAALVGKRVVSLSIEWVEDVRRWHPGQDWVLGVAGFGVFDPGINALSIVTRILREPLLIGGARLMTPVNRQSPIAAHVQFDRPHGRAVFDWRASGEERRTIRLETDDGVTVEIADGGNALAIDAVDQPLPSATEYQSIYARFAELVAARTSEVDAQPLRLVAEAFMLGARETVEPFDWS